MTTTTTKSNINIKEKGKRDGNDMTNLQLTMSMNLLFYDIVYAIVFL